MDLASGIQVQEVGLAFCDTEMRNGAVRKRIVDHQRPDGADSDDQWTEGIARKLRSRIGDGLAVFQKRDHAILVAVEDKRLANFKSKATTEPGLVA
jgi:hypothetical protein